MDKEEIGGCAPEGCAGCSGCGSDQMSDFGIPDDFSPVITLTDDQGNDVQFEIVDIVVMDDEKEYLIVSEVSEQEDQDDVEVVILEIKEENGEEVYDTVTDDEIGKAVFDRFVEQQKELEENEED